MVARMRASWGDKEEAAYRLALAKRYAEMAQRLSAGTISADELVEAESFMREAERSMAKGETTPATGAQEPASASTKGDDAPSGTPAAP
jgi:hypothetical protein